jgi:hypothetical protein
VSNSCQREIRKDTRVTLSIERNLGETGTPDKTDSRESGHGQRCGQCIPPLPRKNCQGIYREVEYDDRYPDDLVKIDRTERKFILDTGASISLNQPYVSRNEIRDADVMPKGVTGANLYIEGSQEV